MKAKDVKAELERRLNVCREIEDKDVAICVASALTDMIIRLLSFEDTISLLDHPAFIDVNTRLGPYLMSMANNQAAIDACIERAILNCTEEQRALEAPIEVD